MELLLGEFTPRVIELFFIVTTLTQWPRVISSGISSLNMFNDPLELYFPFFEKLHIKKM